ncbi:MAG: lytic transglycosylase domain-containing protein [Clostridia bacterium]|nr:lytic transglycosylase domain-containing protein [Clostridia bacterium]
MKKTIYLTFFASIMCVIILFIIFNFVIYPTKHKNYVLEYSKKYNLDRSLIYAIIKTESNFDKNAVSLSNAKGLMQIIPSTAKWIAEELGENYSEEMLFDVETNIKFGCFYLNYLFDKFKNTDVVICAYNAGETAVRNWLDSNGNIVLEKVSYSETKNYYKKVKSYHKVYKNKQIFI